MAVTLKDIAKVASTTEATVSLVINGRHFHRVSPATRQQIEQAAKSLGYHPHVGAQQLSQGKTNSISVLVNGLSNTFVDTYIMELQRLCLKTEHDVVPLITRGNPEHESRLASRLPGRMFDGAICLEYDWHNWDCYKTLSASLPFVVRTWGELGPICPFSRVQVDYTDGIRKLLNHFQEIRCGQLGIISTTVDASNEVDWHNLRFQCYQALFDEVGINCPRDHWFFVPFDQVQTQMDDYVYQMLSENPRLDALIVHNADLIPVVYHAVKRVGRRIGQDLAIATFDDSPLCQWLDPTVTVVCEPIHEIAETLVELLMNRLRSKRAQEPQVVNFSTDLIIRESTSQKQK